MLQKVLYELSYELNNRPDWVSIPLRGLLDLFGAVSRRVTRQRRQASRTAAGYRRPESCDSSRCGGRRHVLELSRWSALAALDPVWHFGRRWWSACPDHQDAASFVLLTARERRFHHLRPGRRHRGVVSRTPGRHPGHRVVALADTLLFLPPFVALVSTFATTQLRLLAYLAGGATVSVPVTSAARRARPGPRRIGRAAQGAHRGAAAAREELARSLPLSAAPTSCATRSTASSRTSCGRRSRRSTAAPSCSPDATDELDDAGAPGADRGSRGGGRPAVSAGRGPARPVAVRARHDRAGDRTGARPAHRRSAVVSSEQERWPAARFGTADTTRRRTARGDDTYVEQVLRNLLSNAAKYSPPARTST